MLYHLFAMNFTLIHGISATLFFDGNWGFYHYPQNSKFSKKNFLSANHNSICVYDLAEREFSFVNLEFRGKEVKPHFPTKNKVAEIPCIKVEFITNRW